MMNQTPKLENYSDALRHFDKVKPYRGRESDPRPIGTARRNDTTMRRLSDGSIAMLLYDTPVITYHPDDSITVQGWESQRTNAFCGQMLPLKPGAKYRWQRDIFINALRGYFQIGAHWHQPPAGGNWTRNKSAIVARCDHQCKVRLTRAATETGWAFDEASLTPFDVPVLDKAAARAVSAEYRLSDFVNWYKAIEGLEQEEKLPAHIREDADAALQLTKEGNFVEAFRYVPLIDRHSNWAKNYQSSYSSDRYGRTASSINQLRQELYVSHRLVTLTPKLLLTPAQHQTMRKMRQTYGV